MNYSSIFTDESSGDEGYWAVRKLGSRVAISFALKTGVDIDLLVTQDVARSISSAILASIDATDA